MATFWKTSKYCSKVFAFACGVGNAFSAFIPHRWWHTGSCNPFTLDEDSKLSLEVEYFLFFFTNNQAQQVSRPVLTANVCKKKKKRMYFLYILQKEIFWEIQFRSLTLVSGNICMKQLCFVEVFFIFFNSAQDCHGNAANFEVFIWIQQRNQINHLQRI